MISIGTWESLFLNVSFESYVVVIKLGQLTDLFMDNVFRKKFGWYARLGPKLKLLLIYQPIAVNKKINYDETVIFYSFKSVHWDN